MLEPRRACVLTDMELPSVKQSSTESLPPASALLRTPCETASRQRAQWPNRPLPTASYTLGTLFEKI